MSHCIQINKPLRRCRAKQFQELGSCLHTLSKRAQHITCRRFTRCLLHTPHAHAHVSEETQMSINSP